MTHARDELLNGAKYIPRPESEFTATLRGGVIPDDVKFGASVKMHPFGERWFMPWFEGRVAEVDRRAGTVAGKLTLDGMKWKNEFARVVFWLWIIFQRMKRGEL